MADQDQKIQKRKNVRFKKESNAKTWDRINNKSALVQKIISRVSEAEPGEEITINLRKTIADGDIYL